jgi:hypothetical protein
MSLVLLLAAAAILGGVIAVAMGRGGELAFSLADSAAYGRELTSASDLAAFRPPPAFLGYSAQATDEALRQVTRAMAERDAELALLRREVALLRERQDIAAAADRPGPETAGGASPGAGWPGGDWSGGGAAGGGWAGGGWSGGGAAGGDQA